MAETATALPTPVADVGGPAERGSLQIADRALSKIVTAAAREVDGVAPSGSQALGGLLGSGYPSVELESAGSRVRVQVDVATLWPHPAARVAADVRSAVARRLDELAAVHADSVAVTVRDVVRPTARGRGPRVR
ncbi:Asp23/Gls24 family envelope stress response protein [uncultured Pseudokineococcus sp.]|uniref:Asp23/Gls24 family envelope stress response protein n=1 Tax=uncultured Pseudokineococcus sp. TaxID=1642928 RepID=UPI00260EDB76|nr:Asp23/Gls24 family envelope stress response protein [uncultured Pseudokineococcus sp.]